MRRFMAISLVLAAVVACGDDDEIIGIGESALQAPASLTSTSLDGAIYLSWSDNAYTTAPAGLFFGYRVFSTGYSIDDDLCDETWELEGSTISAEFLAGSLPNGVPRCFGVVAVDVDGLESQWSPVRADTPRPDARNVLMYAYQAEALLAGFRFWEDVNGNNTVDPLELGAVGDGNRTDIDFWVDRDPNGDFYMVPERTGTVMALYSVDPIEDLTSIDVAPPSSDFSRNAIQAVPGFGYVFEMDGGDGWARYGAIRVTHVGTDYMIFDWSYQTDPGNPELSVHGGLPVAENTSIVVTRQRPSR